MVKSFFCALTNHATSMRILAPRLHATLRKPAKPWLPAILLAIIAPLAWGQATFTYRYYRWTPTALRNNTTSNSIQVAEFLFRRAGAPVSWSGASVTVSGGNSPTNEPPANLIDGSAATKWLNFNKFTPVLFTFPTPTGVDSYTFTTANDAPERDPVSWTLEGSNDLATWSLLHNVTGFATTTSRLTQQPNIILAAPLPPAILEFRASPGTILRNGASLQWNWTTSLADQVTITPSPGTVTPNHTGSVVVNPPDSSDTAYTLTVTNATDSFGQTVMTRKVQGGSTTARYLRFRPVKLRDTAAGMIQLADFRFWNGSTVVNATAASNPGGNSPVGEGAANLIDANPNTKWLDFNTQPLLFDLGSSRLVDGYQFTTANDSPGRDPVRWTLESSNDQITWNLVDNLTEFDLQVPENRLTGSQIFPLPGNSLVPEITASASPSAILPGQSTTLTWNARGVSSLNATPGIGSVPATGSMQVNPSETTTYTFTATNGDGRQISRSVEVVVVSSLPEGQFNFAHFGQADAQLSMELLGNAAMLTPTFPASSGPLLRITPDATSQAGTAWMRQKQPVADGFQTSFTFRFPTSLGPGADGMAFVLHNHPDGLAATPSTNHERGLASHALSLGFLSFQEAILILRAGSLDYVAVDLRTVPGLTLYSTGSGLKLTDIGGTRAPFTLALDYTPGSLDVRINNILILDDLPIDLESAGAVDGQGRAYLGFTGRTGGSRQAHDVLAWSFQSTSGAAAETLTWTGAQTTFWNEIASNWQAAAPRIWNNQSRLDALFAGTGPRTVTVAGTMAANRLIFTAPNYQITGGTLQLSSSREIRTNEDALVSTSLTGSAGLRKTGPARLTLTGANSYAGTTLIEGGTLEFSGSGHLSGTGAMIMGLGDQTRSTLRVNTSGEINLRSPSGNVLVGVGNGAAAAIIHQTGTVATGGPGPDPGYLVLGGGASASTGSYGFYHLAGGSLDTGGGGAKGFRVGDYGRGVYLQSGGTMTTGRWLPIGGNGGNDGEGLVTITGGTATVDPLHRIHIADRPGAIGTLNLGTMSGGNGLLTSLDPGGIRVGQDANGSRATVNLNSGSLVLGGPLSRTVASSAVQGVVNLNGGTLTPGVDGAVLMNETLSAAYLYNRGLTVDTAGRTATISGELRNPDGKGFYPAGGSIAVPDGGAGYLGAPLVEVLITDIYGAGLSAVAEIENGSITRLHITCPGRNLEPGDLLTFRFHGGGPTTPAPDYVHMVTAGELQENGQGTLTKTGTGRLFLNADAYHAGLTEVRQGILEANGLLGDSEIRVLATATLAGVFDSLGNVRIHSGGTFAPGRSSQSGLARSTGTLTLEGNSAMTLRINQWNGTAGSGHDSSSFGAVAIQASPSARWTLRIQAPSPTGFVEENRQFLLIDSAATLSGHTANNWQIQPPTGFPGTGTWSIQQSGNQLHLLYTAGGPAGTDYDTWLAQYPGLANPSPDADPDGDGIANRLEYVLGGHPSQPFTAVLPTARRDQGDLVFDFVRRTASKTTVALSFESSTTLGSWNKLPIPATTQDNIQIQPDTPAAGLETIRVRIPSAQIPQGRIFGRLRAEDLPN
jgi:autotransporter-associated beta strand protein